MSDSKFKLSTSLRLLSEAAPFMAVLAYKGGSLLAKQWLENVYELGIARINPADTRSVGPSDETQDNEANV